MVAPVVAACVVFGGLVSGFANGDAGGDALFLQSITEPVGIVATISEQRLGFGKFVQQAGGTDMISDLPCGHEETVWTVVRIGNGMELGVHAACRASDQASLGPFFCCKARGCAVGPSDRFEIGRIDHHRLAFAWFGQWSTYHYQRSYALEPSSLRRLDNRAQCRGSPETGTIGTVVVRDDPARPSSSRAGLSLVPGHLAPDAALWRGLDRRRAIVDA